MEMIDIIDIMKRFRSCYRSLTNENLRYVVQVCENVTSEIEKRKERFHRVALDMIDDFRRTHELGLKGMSFKSGELCLIGHCSYTADILGSYEAFWIGELNEDVNVIDSGKYCYSFRMEWGMDLFQLYDVDTVKKNPNGIKNMFFIDDTCGDVDYIIPVNSLMGHMLNLTFHGRLQTFKEKIAISSNKIDRMWQ